MTQTRTLCLLHRRRRIPGAVDPRRGLHGQCGNMLGWTAIVDPMMQVHWDAAPFKLRLHFVPSRPGSFLSKAIC